MPTASQQPQAIIVGAGIGGLTTALALHAVGISARVFESAREIKPLGVGINLLPHAVKELTGLGLLPDLIETGVQTQELRYFSKHGAAIWQEPRGIAAGYQWPQISIHRGRLQLLLLRAVRDRLGHDAVRTGHHLASFEEMPTGAVRARFADRHTGARMGTAEADLHIGADGIHSAVRAALHPGEGLPLWNGAVLWRAVTRAAPFLTGRTMMMAGHATQKFVAYPIAPDVDADGRALINWVAEIRGTDTQLRDREDWNRRGDSADFLPAFAAWRFDWLDIPALIRDAEAIYEYPMVDRDPLESWGTGRVTLLGDAAHPMYPVGSNGASQAILDAAALATALTDGGTIEGALRAYEARRLPATARIILSNREQGPERVMQIVEERAPNGFTDLDAVISRADREAIAAAYKHIAGFDRDALNQTRQ